MLRTIIDDIGGRKFLLCMLVFIASSFLILNGNLESTVYRDIILGTAGIYIAGNVSQKVFIK